MQNKDFLNQVFDVLNIPEEEQEKVKNEFNKVLSLKLLDTFVQELPEGQREEFVNLLKDNQINKDKITQWLESKDIKLSEESKEKMENVFKETAKELFKVLIKDVSEEEKQKLLNLIGE